MCNRAPRSVPDHPVLSLTRWKRSYSSGEICERRTARAFRAGEECRRVSDSPLSLAQTSCGLRKSCGSIAVTATASQELPTENSETHRLCLGSSPVLSGVPNGRFLIEIAVLHCLLYAHAEHLTTEHLCPSGDACAQRTTPLSAVFEKENESAFSAHWMCLRTFR